MSSYWHLAIESSGLGGSVSLFRSFAPPVGSQPEDNPPIDSSHAPSPPPTQLQCQIVLPPDGGSVRTLAPAIDDLLRRYSMRAKELAFLSVTLGPGSFTGLRVGLATAKMLAMAANLQIVPIDTLALIGERFRIVKSKNAPTFNPSGTDCRMARPVRLVTAINAFRRQVFSALWCIDVEDRLQCIAPACVVDASAWQVDPWSATLHAASSMRDPADERTEPDGRVWITGPGLSVVKPSDPHALIAEPEIWSPMSENMGTMAWTKYRSGQAVTAEALAPNYIRSSAAEEKARL